MSRKNLAVRLLISAKDEASGVLGGLRRNAGKVAAAIAGYFGIKMFAGAISSAADFQEQMSVVQAITQASAEEMDLLKKAADEAGATTRYSATEAAGALESLARAGLNARESVDTLPAVLALAQGNGLELGQAAGFITQAVRGMGLEFDQSGRVADVLAKGAASANTTVEGLGNALSYAAPTANALGLTLEETVAIIGKFADAGIDASRAGTALNSILAQFSDPASKFRQEMASLGIYTTDFYEAIEQLSEAGPAGQTAIRAVGREAGPALQALLSQGIGSLKELRGELNNASGSAQTAAETMDSNLRGALRGLGSVWDAVKRTLVDPLLDPITEQVNRLTSRLRSFVSEGVVQRAGEILASVFTAAQENFNNFLDNFDLDKVIQQLKGWLDQTKETVDVWVERLQTAGTYGQIAFLSIATGIHTLQAAMHGLAGVVAQVIAGVVDRFGSAFGLFGRFSSTARQLADDADNLARSFRASAEENYQKAAEAIDKATDSGRELQEAFLGLSETQQAASESIEKLVESEDALAVQSGITADQLDALGDSADYMGDESQQAAAAIDAVTSSATNANEEMAKAEVAAAKLAYAYEELGITSQAALDEAAERARSSFETIKNSGQATTRELQQAFQAYAQRAIEANNGVASHALKAEAAQQGLKIEADQSGRVIVEAMTKAVQATGQVKLAADDAARSYQRLSQAAKDAGDKKEGKKDDEDVYKRASGKGPSGTGKFSLSELRQLDPKLAQEFAEAIAWTNTQFTSYGARLSGVNDGWDRRMRAIDSQANAILRKKEQEQQSSSNSRQSTSDVSSLDDLSKAMEQALVKAIPQAQQASKKVELTLNLPGNIKTTGMFDESEADRLMRELNSMARISR